MKFIKRWFTPIFIPQILFTAFSLAFVAIIPILFWQASLENIQLDSHGTPFTEDAWVAMIFALMIPLAFLGIGIFGDWNRDK